VTVVYSWPDNLKGVVESRFYLRTANLSSTSPYTGQRSAYGPTAQIWVAELTFPAMQKQHWRYLSGFLSRLDGISGLVRMPDAFRINPLYNEEIGGTITGFSDDTLFEDGTGFIEGMVPSFCSVGENAAVGADSIVIQGLPESTDGIFRSGDLIEAQPSGQATPYGNLYEVVGQGNSDGDGKSRVYIRPGLRVGLAEGDAIKTVRATSVFRLANDQEGIMNRTMPDHGRLGLTLVEKLPQ
jgi:hypothetical protein